MKISKETEQLLVFFKTINNELFVKKGTDIIKTSNPTKSLIAFGKITEAFPTDLSIYDLNNFIASYKMIEDATLDFYDDYVTISNDKETIHYRFADESMVNKTKSLPKLNEILSFTLSSKDFASLKKASLLFNHEQIVIRNTGDKFIAETTQKNSVSTSANSQKNGYSISIESALKTADNFKIVLDCDNLMLLNNNNDYRVSIHATENSVLLTRFDVIGSENELHYYVVCCRGSEIEKKGN